MAIEATMMPIAPSSANRSVNRRRSPAGRKIQLTPVEKSKLLNTDSFSLKNPQ